MRFLYSFLFLFFAATLLPQAAKAQSSSTNQRPKSKKFYYNKYKYQHFKGVKLKAVQKKDHLQKGNANPPKTDKYPLKLRKATMAKGKKGKTVSNPQ